MIKFQIENLESTPTSCTLLAVPVIVSAKTLLTENNG